MVHHETMRLFLTGGIGLCAQITVYALYSNPIAFYLDGFTTSLIQLIFNAIVMTIIYRPFFHCSVSNSTTRQKVTCALLVCTYFLLTTSRLPVPLFALVLCVIASDESTLVRSCRAIVATDVIIGNTK